MGGAVYRLAGSVGVQVDLTKQRKYDKLAAGPFFAPVVAVATAYVSAAIADPAPTEGEFWALSCLPGTTPGRLSAVTMRITDMLVIYKVLPKSASSPVDALMIVERTALEAGFGGRSRAQRKYPHVQFVDSTYHGAGEDQMLLSGPADEMVAVLADDRVAEAARALAQRMIDSGRVMHWRGHNRLLTDHVLGRA